ncbi:hypothetical protein MESS2_690005 [Mesorhizobium metallidurans STM 2683]|uniref:Uncharacterized protein n=1 Tax=Mesorhizobium metallidurans STM 2683 TaxID=1297569 RepID=M5EVN5_9HYPH|nr:hypothetical protein MESS2_690005 [Mesorhizobium metallidurans STM 2683]
MALVVLAAAGEAGEAAAGVAPSRPPSVLPDISPQVPQGEIGSFYLLQKQTRHPISPLEGP